MRGRRVAKVFKIVLIVLTAAAVLTLVVTRLWNWLMPSLFGLHTITYWQALGLLVLSRILLGGFRGRPHGGPLRALWTAAHRSAGCRAQILSTRKTVHALRGPRAGS